jgi:DNA-directed RNA polymerase subunit RPC12/RpoP
MEWLRRLRLKFFGVLLAITLTCLTVLTAGVGWLSIPVVGAALWAVVVTVNRASVKASLNCWSCGERLDPDQLATGDLACPSCGTLRQPGYFDLADTLPESDRLPEAEFEEFDSTVEV